MDDAEQVSATTSKRKAAEWFELDEDHNTHVYVSGLPEDMTENEFVDLMKVSGIIAKKTDPGHPFNIKMYKNEDGSFKGDARCCFVRPESVELAIIRLDGYHYDDKHILKCERAKFEPKGSYDPSKKPRPLDKRAKLKQKKTVEKLLSWELKGAPEVSQKKVILKNMFSPEEVLEDAELIIDLKQDVEDKCLEICRCEPKRVDIFDKHPEGIIAVTFAEASQAIGCVEALNNQFYAGRVVKAELWDGKTKYKVKETDEESQKRLEKWHEDIQKSDDEEEDKTEAKDDSVQIPIENRNT